MYDAAGWSSDGCHLKIIELLVQIGHSFEEADESLFASWPNPSLPQAAPMEMYGEPAFQAVDPFYVESLVLITSENRGAYPQHLANDAQSAQCLS